jgi:hypothetical protein
MMKKLTHRRKVTMKFEEAMKNLEAGHYVQRDAWKVTGEYLVALPGIPYVWRIVTQPQQNAGTWVATREDYQANDYEVVKKDEDKEMLDAA